MSKNKLLLLLVLLMTAATGAWAQSAFTAKEITSASQLTSTDDEAYVAACMPSDFLAVDADVAKAWTGAPTNGSAILIYAIDGNKIKLATFLNGDNKATFGETWSIATFKNQLPNAKFFYTAPPTYSVTLAEGTEDFDKWTIEPTEAAAGSPVTATYKGEKKVKSVKAVKVAPAATDLATITADYEAKDGETLTGTLASNVKISIADGATVTLDNVTISGVDDGNYMWAGLNCLGDATIILKDGTKNKITGFHNHFPAIYIPGDRHNPDNNKTLIIKGGEQGTGKLIARNNGEAAAIGGVKSDAWLNQLALSAGNIEIQGGVIEAYAGRSCAAIGAAASDTCGYIRITGGDIIADGGERGVGIGCGIGMNEAGGEAHCGDITITGGKIEAYGTGGAAIGSCSEGVCGNITISGGIVMAVGTSWGCPGIGSGYKEMYPTGCGDILINGGVIQAYGGSSAPGIGSGGSGEQSGTCGSITITSGVTKLYAERGTGATNSIGLADNEGKCGTVTIGGTTYWQNGSYVGEGSDYLQQNPIQYEPTN